MVFTTVFFTFYFLLGSILLWTIAQKIDLKTRKTRLADIILIMLSLLFFCYKNFHMLWWIIAFVAEVFVFGLLIEQIADNGNDKLKKKVFTASIIGIVCLLVYYKYVGFTIELVNLFFKSSIVMQTIAAPLGISFLTFTAISYLSDIYLGKSGSGNFLDCALYIAFFPKIISGPIVLWRDFSPQITQRDYSLKNFVDGINKICIGYGKKVILADTFGSVIAQIDANYAVDGVDIQTAWLAVILYWLQIYYDFSGYSDIALGLSQMFGFKFKENFNFPYRSKSISEFWRRWHISLGTWFREYIYFPLGGSRRGSRRTVLNLGVVFLLTGIWHGAGNNYILWGCINGFFVIFEHIMQTHKTWTKIPKGIKWFFTTVISVGFWELFRFPWISSAYSWACVMIGRNSFTNITFMWQYYLTSKLIFLTAIGILGATLLGSKSVLEINERLSKNKGFIIAKEFVYIGLFIIAILFMVNSTYSPFIYFQY